jgi:hypothetical protein
MEIRYHGVEDSITRKRNSVLPIRITIFANTISTHSSPTIVIMSMRDNHIHRKDEDSRIMMILDSLCKVQISNGLNMQEIGNLDLAMSNNSARKLSTENRRVSGSQRVASLSSVAEVDRHEKHSYYSASHEYRT